jgi:hypothetical protein
VADQNPHRGQAEKTACFQSCSDSVGERNQRVRTMLVRRITGSAALWCSDLQ